MKTFIKKIILFVGIPLIIIEILFRVTPYLKNAYEEKINAYWKVDPSKPVKFVFIGTSRVAAAVMEEQFAMNYSGGISINAGRGYTTPAIHYLGLKYLIEKKHANLKDATILFETPSGNCIYSDSWHSSHWVNGKSPHLIIPYLTAKDLFRFWKLSSNTFSEKLNVTLLYTFRSYRYLSFTKSILERNSFSDFLAKAGLIKRKATIHAKEQTLAERGGIKADTASIKKGREKALEFYSDFKSAMRPLSLNEYENSIFNDMYRLLGNQQARVGLFSIPLSSVQKGAYESEIAKRNASEFRKFTRKYNIQIIEFDFKTTDDDFPDLWHISSNKAIEFTKAMINKITNNNIQHSPVKVSVAM